jgi:hypothetical protein
MRLKSSRAWRQTAVDLFFERQPVSLERQAPRTQTHRQPVQAEGGRLRMCAGTPWAIWPSVSGSWRAICSATPSNCAVSLRGASPTCPESIPNKPRSRHASAQLHTGGAQTRSTPQISGTLCLSSIVQRQHLQHTAAKVRVPVVPGTGMCMGFNGPGLAGPRAGGVLQVGSVRAGEGAGVIGRVDAAGVLRHGLFSPKAEGRRPNPRGMRHHLAGSLWMFRPFFRAAASSNPSLKRSASDRPPAAARDIFCACFRGHPAVVARLAKTLGYTKILLFCICVTIRE